MIDRAYNLATDLPWITVADGGTQPRDATLIDVFRDAPRISDLAMESPLQNASVLRMLEAILYRALSGPRSEAQWRELTWEKASRAAIAYLRERADDFWLIGDKPFLQTPGMEGLNPSPLSKLKPVYRTQRSGLVFHPSLRASDDSMDPADAARWMLVTQHWDTGGSKGGPKEGNPEVKGSKIYGCAGWCGFASVLYIARDTLADTLLANLIPITDEIYRIPSGPEDIPSWEKDPVSILDVRGFKSSHFTGIIDAYTHMSRSIRLDWDEAKERVIGASITYNACVPSPKKAMATHPEETRRDIACDPMAPIDDKGAQAITVSSALWQGFPSVLPRISKVSIPIIEWADRVCDDVTFVRIGEQYGESMGIFDTAVKDKITIPSAVLDDELLLGEIRNAYKAGKKLLEATDSLLQALDICDGFRPAKRMGVTSRKTDYHDRALAAVGDAFNSWLLSLPGMGPIEARDAFRSRVRTVLSALVNERLSKSSMRAFTLKADPKKKTEDAGTVIATWTTAMRKNLALSTECHRAPVAKRVRRGRPQAVE
jgi:CRISPR system Cascade subunit CasA